MLRPLGLPFHSALFITSSVFKRFEGHFRGQLSTTSEHVPVAVEFGVLLPLGRVGLVGVHEVHDVVDVDDVRLKGLVQLGDEVVECGHVWHGITVLTGRHVAAAILKNPGSTRG